jgi:hypothetical protein
MYLFNLISKCKSPLSAVILFFLSLLIFHLRKHETASVRQQSRIILIGSLVAFVPIGLWLFEGEMVRYTFATWAAPFYNAIYVEGDAVGSTLFYGRGAGDDPTGSAVIADIVDIGRTIVTGGMRRMPALSGPGGSEGKRIRKMADIESMYYFRFSALDQPGVLHPRLPQGGGWAGFKMGRTASHRFSD